MLLFSRVAPVCAPLAMNCEVSSNSGRSPPLTRAQVQGGGTSHGARCL